MTNGLSPAGLIARSAAFARSLAPRKPFPFRQRRGGVRSALKPASLLLAAAVLLVFIAVDAASSPVQAQDATITSLLSRLDVRVVSSGATTQSAGYDASNSQGSLSPAGFNYPAGFGPWYMVEALAVNQGTTGNPTSVVISVRGTVTSVASSGTHRARVLPSGASITLHLEGENFSKSYSLKNPNERTVTKCVDVDEEGEETERHCRVGETTTEEYDWTTNLPPRLANGDKVIVRLRYSAPRPGKPGTPTVTAPTGKSGALVVEWTVPMIPDPDSMDASDTIPDPKVRGYEVHLSPAAGETDATGVTKTTGGSTTRLPVLLLEPDTAYDVRVRARTYLASGPWSDTATATTEPLQGANNPQVELDLNVVTEVKQGDSLPLRLKVTGMANLHAGAFDMYLGKRIDNLDVEFRVLGGIAEWYEYEDGGGGCGGGAFYGGGLTIGEDGEVYHDFGSLMIPDNKSDYGPLYIWIGSGCGAQPHSQFSIGSTANSRATALCVEIADDSNTVPSDRECPSMDGSAGHAVDRLTGRFVNVPQSHDGESEFTVRLAFVKDVGISPTSLHEDALAATGGAVTQVQRVDDRSDLFEITVEPDSDEDVTITLSSSGDCGESGSICTQGEDPRKLYNSPTATVAGPILTASFQGLPSQHDGETAFSFRIAFSDEVATDEEEFRDHSVEVWGGEVTRAEPVGQRRDLWEVEVEPASENSVMVSLKLTQSCAATGAVCTAGGRLLSVVPATMVPGPATWPVQITGEARVGKTLTADSSNLSERYGVQVTSMTYRWLADGARVPGANARTYKPDDDKQGKRISVMATYTDDRGNEETVISAPTEPLAARDRIRRATGLPLISGRALVGHTLTADTSLIIDPNGLENAVFHYFWEADDDSIPDATDSTYTPVEADVGKEITVIVAWVDDAGHGQNMTSQPTMPVMTAEAAAAMEFRKSLRAAANADGSVTLYWNAPDEDVTGYRILRHRHSLGELDPLVYVADTGSTATAYTDTGMVAGVPHNYRVQAIRDGVLGERTIQIKIFPVRKATNSPATGAPAISGTAQVGETLTADISSIADEDGLENVTRNYLWAAVGSSGKIGARYAYQWLVNGADSGSGDHHAGYDNTTYILTEDDVGKAISVRVTFVDDGGHQETLTSAATDPVAAAPQPNSPATGAPTIGGTAQVGETLTVDTSGITDEDGLDDSTFTHQWVREDSVMVASAARSYTPTDGDRGKSVKVRVSFTDDAGNRETRTSTQTATVEARADGQEGNSPATGLPTISGTAQVGETLTADITGIADADGLSGETFTYQWVSGDGTTDTDIENATGATYKLVDADQGKAIKVRVTFTDGGGNEETLTSAPTGPVWGDGPPGAPRNLAATAGNKEVTLSWDPPADNGNAPATGYRIEWRVDGKDYENHWGTARSTTYTTNVNANLANGVKYFFRVKAGNGSGNSQGPYGPASGEVSATPTSGSAVDLGTPVLSNTETLHHGMVQLDWEDVEDAGWYVVQYYHIDGGSGEWVDLPAAGVDIAIHGSSAVVSNLHGLSWLRVRAMSCAGASEWSQIEQSFGTNASDWEGVPVPEVAEGDEIEPCPVVLGTPVLSDTETLHHGMVQLDWEDIEDAGWYVVQYYHIDGGSGEWVDLPAEGVDIAIHGSSAVVSNLHGLSWLRVRAMSCAGASEWSQIEQSFGTNASDWEGVPVPEVEEGDEIEPCSEDTDTPDNSPATGAPTIGGTAQVGQTLTSNTSGIADADGLTNVSFTYQWLADDADISGATNATYTLVAADEGKAIKVQVGFTDDAGNDESLTSEPTAVVAAALPPPPDNVRAVAKKSGAVELTWDAPQDATVTGYRIERRPTGGTPSDQGRSAGSPRDNHTLVEDTGSTDTGYTDNTAERGVGYEYRVSARNEAGAGEESDWVNAEEATASNSTATGAPTISGTAQVGETLTANTSGVADADGLSSVQYEYQWLADDSDIAGATNATYTLTDSEESKVITVQVSFTDDADNEETLTSEATDEVAAKPNTPATGAPSISGTAQVGETLTANTSGIVDADGLTNAAFTYQWLADDADISGATNATYTLEDADEGKAIKVQVGFTDDQGNEESLTSGATDAVDARPNSPATGAPTISGTAQVGETLEADTSGITDADGLSNVQYEYQWLADDADISGATNATYTLADADEGKAISLRVSFTDDADNEEALTSAAIAAVAAKRNSPATGAPTIDGTVQVGETLTANTSGIADADGLSNVQYEYQWLADDAAIESATGYTYTLSDTDEGKAIKVQVSFTDDEGNAETLTSAGTAVPPSTTPGEPQNLELTPVAVGTNGVGIKVFWDAPSATGGSDISGYRIQWKGGSQDYPDDQETRQAFVENAPYTIDTTSPTPIEGDELTVRIAAVSGAGAGVWTEKIGWLPSHTDLELWLLMKEYADAKQTTFPWVLETWKYLDRYEVPVEVGPTPGFGSVILLPCGSPYTNGDDGLKECHVEKFKILQIEDPKPRIIIHEMAHVYSLANRVTEAPGPLAIAHLYFDSLNLQGGLRGCEPRELYADVLTMLTLDIDESSYWKTCNGDNAQREAQALDVLRSAVDGEMPQWFADTYTDAEDEPDLERLWTDVQDLPRIERNVAVYQLRDAFGGYCNNRLTWKSMQYSEDKLTQPWMDGGCPPPEPSSLEVTPGDGELTLAWHAPASDGDSDVEGYIVQWKSAYHDWAIRQPRAVLDSPTSLTYTISGLGNGVPYDVRVRAYNAIGPGQPLDVESVTPSEPVIPNTPATGVPTISGTAQVGETLTVDTSGIADEDGMENGSFTFLWKVYDATGWNFVPFDYEGTYTIEPRDVGMTIHVIVLFEDDRGNFESVGSASTDAVAAAPAANSPTIGVPTISGTAQVGETLEADTSGVTDADGLSNVQYEYQWLADDADISGATGSTYTVAAADEGKAITVQVSFTDDADNEETLTSAATAAVAAAPTPNSPATGAPTINGTAQVGETLTANTSGIADADGLSNVQYEYQWLADDAEIAGATNSTYTLADTDEGKAIKVRVSFTDDAGNEETLTSAATNAVAAAPQTNSPATGTPSISGTAQVGETLTANTSGIADADGLSSVQYEYQWLADDSEISGATNATYTLTVSEESKAITVQVSFTDDADNEETLTSAATEVVAGAQPTEPPEKPTGLEATATHDSVTLTWDDPGDDSITGYVILRRIPGVDPQDHFDVLVPDTGTNATTYIDDTVSAETRYTYRIKAINGAGTSERSRWVHIDTPAAPVPDKPRGLEATASHNSVTLTWDDPGDDSITGYVILRRVRVNDTGGDFSVLVADTGSATTTYTDDTVAASTTYTYRIKAINKHGTSERSRWVHIDTPAAP